MIPTEELDDGRKPKLFSLAGYNSQPEMKNEIISKIQSLGGKVSNKGTWDEEVMYKIYCQAPNQIQTQINLI